MPVVAGAVAPDSCPGRSVQGDDLGGVIQVGRGANLSATLHHGRGREQASPIKIVSERPDREL